MCYSTRQSYSIAYLPRYLIHRLLYLLILNTLAPFFPFVFLLLFLSRQLFANIEITVQGSSIVASYVDMYIITFLSYGDLTILVYIDC